MSLGRRTYRHEHSIVDPEPARAGLLPAIQIHAVEELDRSAGDFGECFLSHEAILGVKCSYGPPFFFEEYYIQAKFKPFPRESTFAHG
jgi:hypothetical protein